MLPYQRSSWTVYVQPWDWLKGFLLLGTNYDRAWLYDLSLRHPPTLWARSEGSSVSIVHLYCTLTLIHTTAQFLKINLHCCDLVEEGSRGLWGMQFNTPMSKLAKASIYSHCQNYQHTEIGQISNTDQILQCQHIFSGPIQQLFPDKSEFLSQIIQRISCSSWKTFMKGCYFRDPGHFLTTGHKFDWGMLNTQVSISLHV